MAENRPRAGRNRTLTISDDDRTRLRPQLAALPDEIPDAAALRDRIFHADAFQMLDRLPDAFADLMILDPPYNLRMDFHGLQFAPRSDDDYRAYLESWIAKLPRLLKPTGSVYLCCDWKCSAAAYLALARHFKIQNRITWQREKGRGAAHNWKNSCEDIWFATRGDDYKFHLDAVKIRRRVIAPYRSEGQPKDWEESGAGKFRMTCPGNFWDDLTVPYWSMPENTDHPTQKPEKLLAKLILSGTDPGDLVFDPFLGSGTSAATARKLGRAFTGIECNEEYALWALARVEMAARNPRIQGYEEGVFWERNSAPQSGKN